MNTLVFPALINIEKHKSNLKFVFLEVNFVCFRCPAELRLVIWGRGFYLVGAELEQKKARKVAEHKERQQKVKVPEERHEKRLAVREREREVMYIALLAGRDPWQWQI